MGDLNVSYQFLWWVGKKLLLDDNDVMGKRPEPVSKNYLHSIISLLPLGVFHSRLQPWTLSPSPNTHRCTCAHTHTHTHTRTHTHTHTHTSTYTHMHTHIHTHTQMLTRTFRSPMVSNMLSFELIMSCKLSHLLSFIKVDLEGSTCNPSKCLPRTYYKLDYCELHYDMNLNQAICEDSR